MPHIGTTELILVLAVVMIIFGVGRLPEIGGALGKTIREFRSSQRGDSESDEKVEISVGTNGKE